MSISAGSHVKNIHMYIYIYIFSYVLKVLELGVDYISVRPFHPRYGGILLLLLFTRLEACHLRHSHAVCVYLGFALAIYSVLEPPTLKV